jgi:adenine-specific DNA methylase
LNDPFELPSLEEIEEMDRQKSQAKESLEIFDHSVKCQRCGIAVPIVGKLIKPKSNRIAVLEKRIKWLENYSRGNNNGSYHHKNNDIKQLKQELADLLEEDAKADKLRSLPLYSCRITGWKFVSSKCYDKVYLLLQRP